MKLFFLGGIISETITFFVVLIFHHKIINGTNEIIWYKPSGN